VWLQFLVSRVLSRALVALGVLAVIPLGRSLPNASCSLPRGSGRQPSNAPLHGLAPDGVCRAATVTGCAVGSYSTFSPLPEALTRFGRSNFLWHFPRGHPHRALPGILPCGARTFLGLVVKRACDRLRCCNGRELRCSVAGVQVLVGRARAVERDLRTRGAEGARFGDSRWRTLGWGRWAARAKARGKPGPGRSALVGLASFADRDLILPKSAELDEFPGMRLKCLARAGARSVLRCARTEVCGQRQITPLVRAHREGGRAGRSRSGYAPRGASGSRTFAAAMNGAATREFPIHAASWTSSQPLPRESSVMRVFSFFLARASSWRARSRDTPKRRPISASDISSSLSAIKRFSTM